MKQTNKKNASIAMGTFFVLALIGLYVFIYVIPGITGALKQTAVISNGELVVTDVASCVVVREEKTVNADVSGTVSYYIDEGQKTRVGVKVLDIYPSGGTAKPYYCGDTGFVSYVLDGYEDYFTVDGMASIDPSALAELELLPENTVREQITAGEPLYKLVCSDIWYIVLIVDKQNIVKYKQGDTVTVKFQNGQVNGVTSELVDKGDKWLVIVRTDKYYEDFASIRKAEVTVVTQDYEGLIVPNTAITKKDGQTGVFVKQITKSYEFVPVNVITNDGNYSLVSSSYFYIKEEDGTLTKVQSVEIYDEIARDGTAQE